MNSNEETPVPLGALFAALAEEHSAHCTPEENERRRANGRQQNVGERCVFIPARQTRKTTPDRHREQAFA